MVRHLIRIAALTLLAWDAAAQDVGPLLKLASGNFEESYSQTARSPPDEARDPMRTLVGLQFGNPRGQFHIDQVGVMLSSESAPSDYCVRFLSQDARYRAVNSYEKSHDKGAAPRVETRSNMAAKLASDFKSDEVVTRIVAGAGCLESRRGAIVPARPPGADDSDDLSVFLNVPGDAYVRLMAGNTQVGRADCHRVGSRINIYNHICKLSSPDRHANSLKITALENKGPHEDSFQLLWSK